MGDQAEFRVNVLDGEKMAVYLWAIDEVIVDGKELTELVQEYVGAAKDYYPEMNEEQVWITKFASLVAHEIIHRSITLLIGKEASKSFDRLYFYEFMDKIPPGGCHITLWSDGLETNPIGDTWFGNNPHANEKQEISPIYDLKSN